MWRTFAHKRRLLIGWLVVGALSYAAAFFAVRLSRPIGPRIEIPSLPLYLGSGRPGQILEGTIPIRNSGDEPLSFKIITSSGCSKLEPTAGLLQPGQSVSVHVGVRLGTQYSNSFTLLIESNDRVRPQVWYFVDADCRPALSTRPTVAKFGSVREGNGAKQQLTVLDGSGKPLAADTRIMVTTSSPEIRVRPVSTKGGGLAIEVGIDSAAPPGPFSGRIELTVPGSTDRVVVPVFGTVVGEVEFSPKGVVLLVSDAAAVREHKVL